VLDREEQTIFLSQAPVDQDVEEVRRRTVQLTAAAVLAAVVVSVVLATADLRLALMPVAFVLGWLNLVGL